MIEQSSQFLSPTEKKRLLCLEKHTHSIQKINVTGLFEKYNYIQDVIKLIADIHSRNQPVSISSYETSSAIFHSRLGSQSVCSVILFSASLQSNCSYIEIKGFFINGDVAPNFIRYVFFRPVMQILRFCYRGKKQLKFRKR